MMPNSMSSMIQKFVDYGTENYFKMLLEKSWPDRRAENINPFIGVLRYPSDAFLTSNLAYGKSTQSIGTVYIGHIEMLLPDLLSTANTGIAYSLLSFKLDGVFRRFLQISNPTAMAGSTAFQDFVQTLYPDANHLIPFNRNAFHILSDVEITGGQYQVQNGVFVPQQSGAGTFTSSMQFEFAISGFKCLVI